jgi:aspartyl aminopeptidase
VHSFNACSQLFDLLFPYADFRLSTNTGIRAVDLGMPQLSMHSIREMMGCEDLTHAANLFEAYFRDFRSVDTSLRNVDHF